jgi:hypothetical protein
MYIFNQGDIATYTQVIDRAMKKNVIFDHYIGETVGESKID